MMGTTWHLTREIKIMCASDYCPKWFIWTWLWPYASSGWWHMAWRDYVPLLKLGLEKLSIFLVAYLPSAFATEKQTSCEAAVSSPVLQNKDTQNKTPADQYTRLHNGVFSCWICGCFIVGMIWSTVEWYTLSSPTRCKSISYSPSSIPGQPMKWAEICFSSFPYSFLATNL